MSIYWNNIIHTAILGTDKKPLNFQELPEDIKVFSEQLANGQDKEMSFLKTSALLYNYQQCGTLPASKPELQLAACEEEEQAYCSAHMMQLLNRVLDEDHIPLLQLWLQECEKDKYIVRPIVLPALLQKAKQHIHIRSMVLQCGGKRSAWLCSLNPEWSFSSSSMDIDETWLNGKFEERKQVLVELRKTEPAKGRLWLQTVWNEENVASKAGFLKVLAETISVEDKDWLESLLTEKNQKVRDEVIPLLKYIPESAMMQLFIKEAKRLIYAKTEKSMAIFTKQVIKIEKEAVVDEAIFKYGIDKLSSDKKRTDTEWIAYQLLAIVPPDLWEKHFDLSQERIIEQFNKNFPSFLEALCSSTLFHKNEDWAFSLLETASNLYIDLIELLPFSGREKFCLLYVEKHPNEIVRYLSKSGVAWSMPFTRKLFAHTANEVYVFNKPFYRTYLLYIPMNILPELPGFEPHEEYKKGYWRGISEEISKLLELKKEITR